ncbi:MAG TPA: flagellar hook-basal body complex protein [Aliiroseovarius sp.]|nr:flagellar hook-basal body complex protein [Aliiroseovarius sp.]
MDNTGYTTLSRQSGLLGEMQVVANNIANLSTTGFRKEGVVFSEFVKALEDDPSLSMALGNVRITDLEQGTLAQTGGTFDFAIEGEGFFMLEGADGPLLTRAGAFLPSETGELVTADGLRLLDSGGAPVFIPPDATSVSLAADGTLSANGRPLTEIGLFTPSDPTDLTHRDGVRFAAPGGTEPFIGTASILQGYLESSNVNPISEISRMIEVQRAYEMGQQFLTQDDERVRNMIRTMGQG